MRYIKLTAQYMYKNILYISLVMLVPSLIIGMLTEPCSMIKFFAEFNQNELVTFGDIFLTQSELNWKSLLIGLLLAPIVMIFISMLCGLESKHMRWGILSADGLWKRVNNNFLPVFKLSILFLLSMELYALICSAFTFLWVKVIRNAAASLAVTIVTNVLLGLVLFAVMLLLILALPIMSITGFNMRKALGESIVLLKGKFFKIVFAVVVPLIVPYIIMAVLASFGFWWRIFINTILYMFIIPYIITLMYVSYCDIADIDREDLKSKYLKIVEE